MKSLEDAANGYLYALSGGSIQVSRGEAMCVLIALIRGFVGGQENHRSQSS